MTTGRKEAHVNSPSVWLVEYSWRNTSTFWEIDSFTFFSENETKIIINLVCVFKLSEGSDKFSLAYRVEAGGNIKLDFVQSKTFKAQ